MNRFMLRLLVIILILPMLLLACGGDDNDDANSNVSEPTPSKTDNAKSFLEALIDNDADRAKENACDTLHESIDLLLSVDSAGDVEIGDCEEVGDTDVICTIEVDGSEADFTLIMDDDAKVCGGDLFAIPDVPDVDDVEVPDIDDVEVPDIEGDSIEEE